MWSFISGILAVNVTEPAPNHPFSIRKMQIIFLFNDILPYFLWLEAYLTATFDCIPASSLWHQSPYKVWK